MDQAPHAKTFADVDRCAMIDATVLSSESSEPECARDSSVPHSCEGHVFLGTIKSGWGTGITVS